MNMWTELQASALDNLGIPRYQLNHAAIEAPQVQAKPATAVINEQAAPALITTPTVEPEPTVVPVTNSEAAAAATEASEQVQDLPQPVLYQLGPWILQFPQALPVNYYPWLKDLSQFIQSRPTQVSAAGQKAIIDCAFVDRKST